MASQSRRNSKGYSGAGSENGRRSKEPTPECSGVPLISSSVISAPKYGTVVPERVFVGGISTTMSETELNDFFTKYGKVIESKIILDRGGVSKGYGFITFETEEEAKKLLADADNIMLRERKLNIAPAIKKQICNQRLDVGNGTANLVGTPLFSSSSMPFTFSNGVTYFCPHPNSQGMGPSQHPPTTPQPPPPPQPVPPATPATHLDPNLYSGYGGIQAGAPAQFQVVYPPVYYPAPQYQYPIASCEAVEGSINEGIQGSMNTSGPHPVGQLMYSPNGYYFQEVPYQDYPYTHQYVYQPADNTGMPQQHHPTLMQYSAPPPPQSQPRPIYDSPILVPEQSRREIQVSPNKHVHQLALQSSPTNQPQYQTIQNVQPKHQTIHVQPQSSTYQPPVAQKPKEPVQATRSKPPPSQTQSNINPDTNNNKLPTYRTPYPLIPSNPQFIGSQVFPAPQNVYPRPTSSSNTSFHHYSNNINHNAAGTTFFKKYRRPYNPNFKSRGGGRGGSVSSYSSGGGGGLVTPPSTPRSDQPSPDHQNHQIVSSTDHLVHSIKQLKAA